MPLVETVSFSENIILGSHAERPLVPGVAVTARMQKNLELEVYVRWIVTDKDSHNKSLTFCQK